MPYLGRAFLYKKSTLAGVHGNIDIKKEVTLYPLHLSPTLDKGHFSTFLVSNIIFNPLFR